jgi:RNA polymerase sigma factor (sigma-70 family)
MTETWKLLEDYAKRGSEAAFRELVGRYLGLVLSTATRLSGGDRHLAEDVSQVVFIDLARAAGTLSREVVLAGWLHRHTCFVTAKTLRGERRRRLRESQTADMNALEDHSGENLARIAPVLDEAINQLGAQDRAAILLRFFERLDFRAVGLALGSNETAAQKRVSRALEKLHILLKHRGLTLSVATLGSILTTQAVSGAPAEVAARISATALVSAASNGSVALSILKIMSMTKIQLGLSAMIIAVAATTLVLEHQAHGRLDAENQSLRKQIAQLQNKQESHKSHLARPPRQSTAHRTETPAESANIKEYVARNGEPVKLTREQAEAYLRVNGRNAATLLSAFYSSDDPSFLREAMDKFPTDPRVDMAAIFKGGLAPEDQRQWLGAFEQSAPDNSLPNYVSGLNDFRSGQTDLAVQELTRAAGKAQFQDYTQDGIQNDVEAFLAAGYSEADAKVYGGQQLQMASLNSGLKELGSDMVDLANSYKQSGDQTSSQAALQMAVQLGQRLDGSDGPFVIGQMVGMNIEYSALAAMDPSGLYGNSSETVQDQMNQVSQQRAALNDLNNQMSTITPNMTSQDWINYRDRELIFGQVAASQWIVNKYKQP